MSELVLTLRKHTWLAAGLLAFVVLAGFFIAAKPAAAIPSSIFPSPFNTEPQNPNNAFSIVTLGDGANVTLTAPIAQFKVFYPASDNATRSIVVNYGCANPGNDTMNTQITAQIAGLIGGNWTPYDTKDNTSGCTGGDINFTVTTGIIPAQADYYSANYKVVLVTITKTGGVGIKNFRIVAPGGQVTFAESDRGSTANPGQVGPVFSIWDGVDPNPRSERWYRFRFRVDCMYRRQTGANSFWLKWFDADVGAQNELGNSIYFEIRNETTGAVHTVSGAQLGGDGSFGQFQVPISTDNDQFTWTWYNVDRVNGIQVYMPFSEMQDQVSADCTWANPDKPATGWAAAFCTPGIKNGYIDGWAYDPDRPNDSIQAHVYIDGAFVWAGAANLFRQDVANAGIPGNHGFNFPLPDRFYDNNQHTMVAYAIGVLPSGAQSNSNPQLNGTPFRFGPCPPDKPPTGVANATCNQISGWASDADYNGSIRISVRIDNDTIADRVLSNLSGSQGSRHFNIPYPDNKVTSGPHSVVVIAHGVDGNGNDNNVPITIYSQQLAACLQATCTVDFGLALVGEDFDVTVTVTNTGGVAWDTGRYKAGLTNYNSPDRFNASWQPLSPQPPTNGRDRIDLPSQVAPGQSRSMTFKARAPTSVGFYDFGMRMVRQDRPEWFGTVCGRPDLPVNGRFNLVPIAQTPQPDPDPEAPSSIIFVTTVNAAFPTPPSGVNARATREFFWKRNGVVQGSLSPSLSQPNPHDARFQTRTYTDNLAFDASNYQAGDEFCVRMRIQPAQGIVDPNGDIVGSPTVPMAETDGTTCFRLANRPYLKAFGNDVWAGGNFTFGTNGCSASTSTIRTFARQVASSPNDNGYRGSSVEYAAFAMSLIDTSALPEGFYSASLRNNAPIPSKGLTFANTTASWGGDFGANTHCITDFYTQTRTSNVQNVPGGPGRINLTGYSNGQYEVQVGGAGRLVIEGATNLTGKRTLYVNGDVFIENNITFADGWATTGDIPSFALIVEGGSIYISNTVTQLDGMYIAQPDRVSASRPGTGEIFTCVRANGQRYNLQSDQNDFFLPPNQGGCNSVLKVNGAFVAQKVHFLRTSSSLRDAGANEAAGNTRAAEIIATPPEMYFTEHAFRVQDGAPSADAVRSMYDSIVSLPPVY